MSVTKKLNWAVLPIVLSMFCLPSYLSAQSGSRRTQGSGTVRGSTAKPRMAANTALGGYCPVCIIDVKKWVKGDPRFRSVYDGKSYYFPAAEYKKKFDANPVKYVPALGGDCVVCLKDLGKRVPGSIQYASYLGGRLFLFPNAQVKQKFMKNAQAYLNVDLAFDGRCTVCKVEMNKDVAGKADFAVMKNGMRYLFPGEKQMKMFIANPKKYMSVAGGSKGSGAKGNMKKGSRSK